MYPCVDDPATYSYSPPSTFPSLAVPRTQLNSDFVHMAAFCVHHYVEGPIGMQALLPCLFVCSTQILWCTFSLYSSRVRNVNVVAVVAGHLPGAGAKMKDDRSGLHDDVPEFSAYWSSRPLSAALTKYVSVSFLPRGFHPVSWGAILKCFLSL